MLLKDLRLYQDSVGELKDYFEKKISKDKKFIPSMIFSAEQAAWTVLNGLKKAMFNYQEPTESDFDLVDDCRTLKEILEGNLDESCYVEPQLRLWLSLLEKMNQGTYIDFISNAFVPSLVFMLQNSPQDTELYLDDSVTFWDKEFAAQCICDAYQELNQETDKEVTKRLRQVCWNEDYCRGVFNYFR